MLFQKSTTISNMSTLQTKPLTSSAKVPDNILFEEQLRATDRTVGADLNIDLKEIYFLILHFLSAGPCERTVGQLWKELLEHQLLPRRYHAWYSRSGLHSGDPTDDGVSFPLSYESLVNRYSHIEKDHLVKLLKQLMLNAVSPHLPISSSSSAADVPTLLGTGSFSLLSCERNEETNAARIFPSYLRWPHMEADQVRALALRAIGGGFTRHHRAPSIRAACYAIAKPSTMVQKMQNIKKMRGHRNAVYCAIFDRSGRYVITGSDDRLVKIWSMETAFCLASCRGHEGDITDLAVSSNNALVASASNDFVIRVWRLPDGLPISILQGHTAAVTAIAFSPRVSCVYQLLSSSDDGTCRIWDARQSQLKPRIYIPKPPDSVTGRNSVHSSSTVQQNHQILCCAYNANGTAFVTGSSDNMARVWTACKSGADDSEQPHHEIDVLSGHENDVNYVQFSGCAISSRSTMCDALKEEQALKFRNLWFSHDNIVTCSRDGSAIIWIPRSRRSHGKVGRWMKAYHLKVPPPPLPPQPPRGGPRRRILPTPRGVNMIVWSLDNRFVLAAIMDCRICVWNAADGSLVHSLTGHKESTYVLDVHPFNPRIAMSAGYDGRTIIWDIWEGSPVRTFEIGRFKLVDGKFSPDGTSIVLSDDVGQIYLLNTGQGESYKDAKYDQFFLGDYRPLIRDAVGNVLDQETQLPPHRRNMQDQLCDSSMIPYTEPYQSMYQRRRLGTLGMEWRPSSIKFAVGPDFSLSEDYQMMPLEDLDAAFIMPEPVDAALWEPEIEVIDDDTDSEYNVLEEESSEKEPESLSDSSFSDIRNSGAEQRRRDRLCRSKRKNDRAELEFTASGRRVKKRNLEEHGGSSSRNIRKKVANGKKVPTKRSLKAKISRPQRNAAQNAMNIMSLISETSSDEEEFAGSESDSSGSELFSQHSILQNIERDRRRQNRLYPNESTLLDGSSDASEPVEDPESQANAGNRKRLVLKFSVRDSKKPLLSGSPMHKYDNSIELDSSNSSPMQQRDHYTGLSGEDPGLSVNASDAKPFKRKIKIKCKGLRGNNFGDSNMSLGTMKDNGLGEAKVQSPKQLISGELLAGQSYASPTGEDVTTNSFDISAGIKGSDTCNDGFVENGVLSGNNCSRGSKENAKPSKLKLKYYEQKTPKLKLNTGVSDPRAAEDYSVQRTNLAAYGVSEEDSSFVSECSDYDLCQAEADAIRRTRSLEMKATPRQLNIGVSKLMLKKGDRSVGTSKAVESSHIESRSSKSKRETLHDAPNLLTVYQPSFAEGKIPWLMLSEHEPGYRYIPQLGDAVVYLRQGHQEYIETSCSDERGPWVSMKGELDAVVYCQVEKLVYAVLPGSGESCCKITLQIIDQLSNVHGKKFKLTLPELVNFPDFVVEKSRFEDAMLRNWAPRDKCLVWWRNESGEGGSWWEGRVVSEKPKSSDFPDSPWERFVIHYKGDPDEHLHSPWELHDPDGRWEHPHIDYQIRNDLLACFNEVEQPTSRNKDSYGVKKLKQVSQKLDFLNRYPVPLSPDVIQSRLEHNYYRSLDAVKHDIEVMMKNAEDYFAKNADLLAKMRRLSGYLRKMVKCGEKTNFQP